MALEITSVGASVKYAWETSAGTKPSTGFTVLPDVSAAPDFDMSVEVLDCSNITDKVTRYTMGRQDPGGDASFTLNHTEAVITAWTALVTARDTNMAAGKRLWFEYCYPGATKSFFWAGYPVELGNSGIAQNEVDTIPAHVVVNEIGGWDTATT